MRRTVVVLGMMLGAAAPARAELARVWAVSDGEKIGADDTGHPLAAGNAVFDAETRTVRLFGLRNETVAFQVVLEGGGADTEGASVQLAAVGPVRNAGATDDPDRYFVGRHIEIFHEPMLPLSERSHSIPWAPGTDAEPEVELGPIPDPLEPHRAPVTVPAGENRVFWVDLWIPRDAPAGRHAGELVVRAPGCPDDMCRLGVELEIGDAALPEVAATRTMLFYSGGDERPKYVLRRYLADPTAGDPRAAALRRRHHQLARRHRVSLFFGGEEFAPTDELAALVSGATFTPEMGYAGPGEGVGIDVYPFYAYGGRLAHDDAVAWAAWFGEHGPEVDIFLYTDDEPPPDPALTAEINDRAREAEPVPSFVTTSYDPAYEVDIFAALASAYRERDVERARDAGRQVWIYNGVRPHSGSFAIDDVAVSTRVNPWIQHARGIPRWFYWEATYYLDFQGDRGQVDVWSTPMHFSNRHGDRVNGDGLLFYPGRDLLFPDSDRGIDRPLPSIRLKNWRRGIEDVEYLRLARARGHGELVDAIVAALLPRTLDELSPDEPVPWPEDGARWHRARRLLFDAITTDEADLAAARALARPPEPWLSRARRSASRLVRPLFASPKRTAVTLAAAALACAAAWLAWRRLRRRRAAS